MNITPDEAQLISKALGHLIRNSPFPTARADGEEACKILEAAAVRETMEALGERFEPAPAANGRTPSDEALRAFDAKRTAGHCVADEHPDFDYAESMRWIADQQAED